MGDDEPATDPHLDPFIATIYDGEHGGASDDVDWAVSLAAGIDEQVADLGCGTGRLSLPLALAGRRVIALDRAPAMLTQLRRKLRAEAPAIRRRVTVLKADLRTLDQSLPVHAVGLAVLGYNTFASLMTSTEQQRCLLGLQAALRPGGALTIATAALSAAHLLLPEGFTQDVYRRAAPELGSGVTLSRMDIHRWTDQTHQIRRLAHVYEVTGPDGGRRQHHFEYAVRYTTRFELEHLLARCGFGRVRVYGGYLEEPFTVAGGLLVALAQTEGAEPSRERRGAAAAERGLVVTSAE